MTKLRVLADRRGRPLRDLRISVTDRCNFRCGYCLPRQHFGKHFRFLPRAELLSFEEIAWTERNDRYSELRSERTRNEERIEMSYVGG